MYKQSKAKHEATDLLFQILCLYDAVETIDIDKLVSYISGLQQEDGSFFGDKWGEVDTRFSFCAVACLSLLVNGIVVMFVTLMPLSVTRVGFIVTIHDK